MAVSLDGIIMVVLDGLTVNVFGSLDITTAVIAMFLILFGLLIRIPLPIAVVIPLPFVIYLTAYGFISLAFGGIMAVLFLVLAVLSFIGGMGVN